MAAIINRSEFVERRICQMPILFNETTTIAVDDGYIWRSWVMFARELWTRIETGYDVFHVRGDIPLEECVAIYKRRMARRREMEKEA